MSTVFTYFLQRFLGTPYNNGNFDNDLINKISIKIQLFASYELDTSSAFSAVVMISLWYKLYEKVSYVPKRSKYWPVPATVTWPVTCHHNMPPLNTVLTLHQCIHNNLHQGAAQHPQPAQAWSCSSFFQDQHLLTLTHIERLGILSRQKENSPMKLFTTKLFF